MTDLGPGWVRAASSAQVVPGRALTVVVDGHADRPGAGGSGAVALWRDLQGAVVAIDDRCPHQWSSLGEVGVVDGAELVCTAHGWRFAADGAACKVAMNGRRDRKDPTRTWPCRELDGQVWVQLEVGR